MRDLIRRIDDLDQRIRDIERQEAAVAGTFTPTLVGSTTPGTITYARQSGYYTRIGDMCFIRLRIVVSGIPVTPTGNMQISGLPFTVSNEVPNPNGIYYPLSLWHSSLNVPAGTIDTVVMAVPFSTTLAMYSCVNNGVSTFVDASLLNTTTQLIIGGGYAVA